MSPRSSRPQIACSKSNDARPCVFASLRAVLVCTCFENASAMRVLICVYALSVLGSSLALRAGPGSQVFYVMLAKEWLLASPVAIACLEVQGRTIPAEGLADPRFRAIAHASLPATDLPDPGFRTRESTSTIEPRSAQGRCSVGSGPMNDRSRADPGPAQEVRHQQELNPGPRSCEPRMRSPAPRPRFN